MNRAISLLPIMLLLAGCAATSNAPVSATAAVDSAPAKQLHTDLVREMIAQGRNYAALAHIEELQKTGGPREELLLLHAQVLARLERNDQAEQEFRQLISGAFEGEARHGLGLLYAQKNHGLSVQYLREAARLRPTDATIRNDFGYSLLAGGQYPEARLQLATAYELDSSMDKYRNNYVLALLLFKDETEVERLRRRSEMSDQTLKSLRAQALAWPAVVKRTVSATQATPIAASAPAPVAAPAVPRSSTERINELKKKQRSGSAN